MLTRLWKRQAARLIFDDDVGLIGIYSSDGASAAKARAMIEYLTADVKVGKHEGGEVKRL